MESILTSIKKMLGVGEEYEHFDSDIVLDINSVLTVLTQLGIGPPGGFAIQDKTAVWKDFLGTDRTLEAVKSYVHLKVKLLFDPPTSAALLESMNRMINELEWRIAK
jgi:hypothetical protein